MSFNWYTGASRCVKDICKTTYYAVLLMSGSLVKTYGYQNQFDGLNQLNLHMCHVVSSCGPWFASWMKMLVTQGSTTISGFNLLADNVKLTCLDYFCKTNWIRKWKMSKANNRNWGKWEILLKVRVDSHLLFLGFSSEWLTSWDLSGFCIVRICLAYSIINVAEH
jgi:hypothetical protein